MSFGLTGEALPPDRHLLNVADYVAEQVGECNVDVLVLQEVWTDTTLGAILDRLPDKEWHATRVDASSVHATGSPGFMPGNGVVIMWRTSRFKCLDTQIKYRDFTRCGPHQCPLGEFLVRKGAIAVPLVTVTRGTRGGRPRSQSRLWVIGTHLESLNGRLRAGQVDTLVKLVQECQKDGYVVLAGDFNCDWTDLQSLPLRRADDQPGAAAAPTHKTSMQVLDHVFHTNVPNGPRWTTRVQPGGPSDHLMVVAKRRKKGASKT